MPRWRRECPTMTCQEVCQVEGLLMSVITAAVVVVVEFVVQELLAAVRGRRGSVPVTV